jgi:hypothetical protein
MNPEELRMNPEEMDVAMERFNVGAPLPTVNPADLQVMWEIRQEPETKAIGLGYYAGRGGDTNSLQGEGFVAMSMRQLLLMSLAARGVLRDHSDGEKLRPEIFRAAATIPCDNRDICEAVALHRLPELSVEEAGKLREQMLAEGCDLDHSRIDRKFLSWLAEITKKPE